MVKDKEQIKKSLDKWLTQTTREQECKDDEVALIAYNYFADVLYIHKH